MHFVRESIEDGSRLIRMELGENDGDGLGTLFR